MVEKPLTAFGNLSVKSPRFQHSACRPRPAKTFSPLAELLPKHISPELLFLETKTIPRKKVTVLLVFWPACRVAQRVT
jgi:hypothetical protein